MKIFRFMSMKEFRTMDAYVPMVHPKHHFSARTSSKGFCFLASEDWDARFALQFLSGIVSADVCVEFEVDEKYLTESCGIYADPHSDVWGDTMCITEYCTPTYSREIFKPTRYSFPTYGREVEWFSYN